MACIRYSPPGRNSGFRVGRLSGSSVFPGASGRPSAGRNRAHRFRLPWRGFPRRLCGPAAVGRPGNGAHPTTFASCLRKVLFVEGRSRRVTRNSPGAGRDPAGEGLIKTKRNDIVNTLETILLVDDEAYIRELVGAILSVEGYQVLEAADGEEALKVGSAFEDKIHLLLTDVVMSPMGGGELVKRIIPVRPDLKVLYISGYPDDPAVRRGLDGQTVSFLAKPFSPKVLVRTIRSILDGVPAEAHAPPR
jgi:CheY-like chemotaxis protein